MTSFRSGSRSRRAASHIAVRGAYGLVGGLVVVGWLVLPLTGRGDDDHDRVTVSRGTEALASEAAPSEDGTGSGDLVLPVAAVGAAGALTAYTYTRRRRRARTRTTPGGAAQGLVPLTELDRRAQRSLVGTDDCVRTSAEELGFVTGLFGEEETEPYTRALATARSELAAAFRLRRRRDDTADTDEARRLLEETVTRCTEAGLQLDAAAAGFDQLRALERNTPTALAYAETRFRELAARTPAAESTLGELRERFAPSASLAVAGNVEQAKDRLLFATTRLNRSRQSLDRGDRSDRSDGAVDAVDAGTVDRAVADLRAAEGAIAQAAVLVHGVERLADELAAAAQRLPAALAALETGVTEAHARLDGTAAGPPELSGRVVHAESVLTDVRNALSALGAHDPLDALRRVAGAGSGLADGLLDHALLPAASSTAIAADFVATHRGAVGWEARARLAEAERHLAHDHADAPAAETLAQRARVLAERDVRAYGHPLSEGGGAGGAVLGGVLLPDGGPASFGGPRTRARRALPPDEPAP
ncbi:hypothetical protein ACIP79_10025 [Streptomyces sp. NPDC088747]|uniref:hypothetical protein n=1 Tax=Streptomyces sp. NPDC088747 TaxID=3365886 RepID=UPI0038044207